MTPRDTARAWLDDRNGRIIDFETTGMRGYAVELAIIDMQGEARYCERFNPEAEIEAGAQAVHGITIDALAMKPPFRACTERMFSELHGLNIVAYNAEFDRNVLERECGRLHGVREWRCAMLLLANGGRWRKLDGGDHSALGDARACLEVVRMVAEGHTGR
jgi:DNA polymerase-3 subunit epsilon